MPKIDPARTVDSDGTTRPPAECARVAAWATDPPGSTMNRMARRSPLDWSSAPVEPGDIIAGKFKVEQVLGTGGVGVVVAARHLQLDERVALKFLLPEAVRSEVDVARFCREAQAAVRLKCEHVARVTDVGTLETGSPYMVMEYLTGTDLSDVLDEKGALPVEEGLDYVLQACEAIAEAHSIGFVHRDIKPSNLFVTQRSDGSPLIKVLDFGIAKATHQARIGQGEQELTRTRTMLGSPMYMSPEQVRNSKDVDERTDIWSLGVVLYEVLTGAVPFEGDSVTGVVAAVVGDPLPPLTEKRPDLPAALSDVVSTCLQKDPEDRFQSVAELAYALKPFVAERSHLSIERIAGTLGTKAKYRTGSASKKGAAASNMAAAKTVKSRDITYSRRNVAWPAAAGAALVAAALAGVVAWSASPASDAGATVATDPPLQVNTTASPESEAAPVIAPAANDDGAEPQAQPEPSASATGPSADPALTPSAASPPQPAPRPARRAWSPPAAQAKTDGVDDIIDSTVDTRR
jgi:serine/threonine protein kinase